MMMIPPVGLTVEDVMRTAARLPDPDGYDIDRGPWNMAVDIAPLSSYQPYELPDAISIRMYRLTFRIKEIYDIRIDGYIRVWELIS